MRSFIFIWLWERVGGRALNRTSKDGRTPVFMAAGQGHTAAIEVLGKLGADVNWTRFYGWTPVHAAAGGGCAAAGGLGPGSRLRRNS